MNRLTAAGVLVEDKLFATLDPTVRRPALPGGIAALLIDTVGFINKLPHGFVDAFKSTLEEVRSADLLLHVVDGSNHDAGAQIAVVERVLGEIGAGERPVLIALNKMDAVGDEGPTVRGLDALPISGRTGAGVRELLAAIEQRLQESQERISVDVPNDRSDLLSRLYRGGRVLEQTSVDGFVHIVALFPRSSPARCAKSCARERGIRRASGLRKTPHSCFDRVPMAAPC